MSKSLDNLLEILALEKIDDGLYKGDSQDLGFGHLFGGQVMGQALSAAQQTIDSSREVHSLHSYFLRKGDFNLPVIYDVSITREGKSFTALRVKAIQKGFPIFYMTCSFQYPEDGFEHQSSMPINIEGPDNLLSNQELIMRYKDKIPAQILDQFTKESAIEIRPVNPFNPFNPQKKEPKKYAWFKANGNIELSVSKSHEFHEYLLAYASDFEFLMTATQPHGISFFSPGVRMATIDHSMWFHRRADMNDWLLYSIESSNASGGRAFVKGEFFNRNGELIASTAQEGILRRRKNIGKENE